MEASRGMFRTDLRQDHHGSRYRPVRGRARATTTPIHTNEEFAATTIFKGRIAHGMLSASVISAAIAE